MYFLLYMSSAPEKFSAAELGVLLDRARKNNAARSVTGMLLHADGNFIQYIEGEHDTVLSLFDMISGDRRHRNIQMLARGEIDDRRFPDWSMGSHELAAEEFTELGAFDLTEANLEAHLDPDMPKAAITMMRQFYRASDRFASS
jgi:hypothetical protein